MATQRKKKSSVWKYFEEKPGNKDALCLICKETLKHHGNTTNLVKHLDKRHPTEKAQMEEGKQDSRSSTGNEPPLKQMKLTDKTEPYPPSHFRKKLLDDKLIRYICKDTKPLKTVDDKGFRDLLETADPRYVIPSRKSVTTDLLPAKYDEIKQRVKKELEEADHIAVTTDLWTSLANDSYMSLTAHFIAKDWKLCSIALSTVHFEKDHTGENIMEELLFICREWSIEQKVKILVSDGAANMQLAGRKLPWYHINCFAHNLHLVVTGAIDKDTDLKVVITKVKSIVDYFHSSEKGNRRLKTMRETLGLKAGKLIQQVNVRWNSCLNMIESVCQQVEALNAVLTMIGKPQMTMTDHEVTLLRATVLSLKPFESATKMMSAETTVTISAAIPLLKVIQNGLNKVVNAREPLTSLLKAGLIKKFPSPEEKSWLRQAAILDPRFKKNVFADDQLATKAATDLQNEANAVQIQEMDEIPSTSQAQADSQAQAGHDDDDLWDFLKPKVPTKANQCAIQSLIEMRQYLESPNVNRKDNPLQFWKDHQAQFPRLSMLARKYLCCPATSVPSERLFSKAGEVISKRRASLSPQNADKIIFLNKNLH